MDVNGTRFHSLLGRGDWTPVINDARAEPGAVRQWLSALGIPASAAAGADDLVPAEWDEQWSGVSLVRRLPLLSYPVESNFGADALRGASADQFGNIYWIDADRRRIRIRPEGLDVAGEHWAVDRLGAGCAPASDSIFTVESARSRPEPQLAGLAVTTRHYLVLSTLEPAGLLVFDLHTSGEPCWWPWPESLGFTPRFLAPAADGGLLILDVATDGSHARFWRLDANFLPAGDGAPLTLVPGRIEDFGRDCFSPRIQPSQHIPPPVDVTATNPIAVVALGDDSVLVLDAGTPGAAARLLRYRGSRLTNTEVLDATATLPHFGQALTDAHALAFVPAESAVGTIEGHLYLATRSNVQVFEWRLSADGDKFRLDLEPRSLPLQGYTGKGLVNALDIVYYDAGDRWIAIAEQPNYRYFPVAELSGIALVFDGKRPGCRWHRIMLDACIPSGCGVTVESAAADDRDDLDALPFELPEPDPYRRSQGSELPFDRPFGSNAMSSKSSGTYETLFQKNVGRWLKLRLTLTGNGRATPRLRSLRVYYPRFSYLNEYLPAVYREEPLTADFLDRFLANIEGTFTDIEGRVEQAERTLDPSVAPEEYLQWLAGWLGTMLENNWGPARRRLFLRNAWLIFRWRGTKGALLALVRLAIEPCPDASIFDALRNAVTEPEQRFAGSRLRIVENFQLRAYPEINPATSDIRQLPGQLGVTARWEPHNGATELHQRYRTFLQSTYGNGAAGLAALNESWSAEPEISSFNEVTFPALAPDNDTAALDWLAFTRSAFAFPYAEVRSGHLPRYREFLAQRYRYVDALNNTYGRQGSAKWQSFGAVSLPDSNQLPTDGRALADWIDFVSLVLPLKTDAHRFTVLVPTQLREPQGERERRSNRIAEIVSREKPAHTDFDVSFFWALFRVGTARLGIDSVIGESGHYIAMVIGFGHLNDTYMAESHPWNVTDRTLVGRDAIKR